MEDFYHDPDVQEVMLELTGDYRYQLDIIYENLQNFSDDEYYYTSVDSLFSIFNKLRGLSDYLKLEAMRNVMQVSEEVMGILRHRKPPINPEITDWLEIIHDQMKMWRDELDQGLYDLTPMDAYSLNMMKISSVSTEKSTDILKTLTFLVVEPNEKLLQKLGGFLKPRSKKVYTARSPSKVLASVDKFRPDIVMTDTDFDTLDVVGFIKKLKEKYVQIPLLIITSNSNDKHLISRLKIESVDGIINKPLNAQELLGKIEQTAQIHYGSKMLKISDAEIAKYIDTIKPLSTTITEVRRLNADRESTTRDMAQAISKDPPLLAKVLKTVNSPLYGFRGKIESIQHGVSLLGKDKIAAIILQQSFEENVGGEIDLSCYQMSKDQFYEVARLRMELVTFWFSRVNLAVLPVLSTSALLGNIGQTIIAREAKRRQLSNDFKELVLKTGNAKLAESELFRTATEDVSADVLGHWGLEQHLIDSVRYAYDLANCPSETKQPAIANYVIFNTIPLMDPRIQEQKVQEMGEFLEEMNLKAAPFQQAVEKLAAKEEERA